MPTDTPSLRRRPLLKVLGGGLVVGSGVGLTSAEDDASDLARHLDEVRARTRAYRDIETARAEGYMPLLGYFPNMGFHFTDRDPPLGADRSDPPVLVYVTTGSYSPEPGDVHDPDHDGDLVLGGVEYLVAGDQADDPPNIFADEASPRALQVTEAKGWHYHADLGITALHAWVHRGNPAGVFHPTNPTIG